MGVIGGAIGKSNLYHVTVIPVFPAFYIALDTSAVRHGDVSIIKAVIDINNGFVVATADKDKAQSQHQKQTDNLFSLVALLSKLPDDL